MLSKANAFNRDSQPENSKVFSSHRLLITFSICLIFQLIFNLLIAHSLNIFYSLQAAQSQIFLSWWLIDGAATGVCECAASECVCLECARSSQLACVHDELLMRATPLPRPELLFYYISALSWRHRVCRCRIALLSISKMAAINLMCEYLAAIFYQYIYTS